MNKTVSVAPMMDCTDKHELYFLSLISKNVHLYTEMIVSNAIIKGDRNKLLSFKRISNPVTLQVGGSNPKELAEACKISEDYGYKEINLNLGCPSKKVQKNKFGACLMQEPDLVATCIESMTKATKLPITIKTRIGYNDVEDFEFLKSFIQRTKDAGSKKFIIHARKALLKKLSPKENLNIPPLKYDFVYKLKDHFKSDEIIINGGVKTIEEIIITEKNNDIFIKISAKSFLHSQVRIMVGTLVEIGKGKITKSINSIIESKQRSQAGITAPACGLYLVKVDY